MRTLGILTESRSSSSIELRLHARSRRAVGERAERARGRGTGWRPRRGCRTARGPGTRSRCRGRWRPTGRASVDRLARRRRSRRSSARMMPGDDLDEGRLAGAVVADEGHHLARRRPRSRRRSAPARRRSACSPCSSAQRVGSPLWRRGRHRRQVGSVWVISMPAASQSAGVVGGADVVDGPEPVGDDGVVDVVHGHRDRRRGGSTARRSARCRPVSSAPSGRPRPGAGRPPRSAAASASGLIAL